MKVAFRADASLHIGTGHVMRCLTLADALAARGAECHFICREHAGHLVDFIRAKGYVVHPLTVLDPVHAEAIGFEPYPNKAEAPYHQWLGATQGQDAQASAPLLATLEPDWLIVDHYALDARWERSLAPHYGRLMVIDDLADRAHECDVLLDQTFGRDSEDYRPLVPPRCRVLCGSEYALLRPEFAALRPYSLQRRAEPRLRELLISMGGVDKDNATGQVLEALRASPLSPECRITVVMGAAAPWLEDVQHLAQRMPWPTRVLVGVSDMAQLMADSDLSIGAAGATSWERCCMGLPSIILVLADNQLKIAHVVSEAGGARLMEVTTLKCQQLIACEDLTPQTLSAMSTAAAAICGGLGVFLVLPMLTLKAQDAN